MDSAANKIPADLNPSPHGEGNCAQFTNERGRHVLTAIYAVLFYIATAVFAAGLGVKIWGYARTPAPLSIALTPAPVTRTGAAIRVLRDAFLFASLFKANKWIWLFGYLFHGALALVLLRHVRYFIEPVWGVIVFIQPFGIYAGLAMVAGLAGLWVRRLFIPRIRYISAPSDHLMLALLLAIGVKRPRHEVPRAHRHRRGESVLPRSHTLGLAAPPQRSGAAGPPGACGPSDDRLPLLEAGPRARNFLQPNPQSGGHAPREAPARSVGRRAGLSKTMQV